MYKIMYDPDSKCRSEMMPWIQKELKNTVYSKKIASENNRMFIFYNAKSDEIKMEYPQ